MKNETENSGKSTDRFASGKNPRAYPCQGTFNPNDLSTAPPHGTQPCGCSGYKGDGRSLCFNRFYDPSHDLTGTGPGTPNRICGHPPENHREDR